MTTIIWVGIYGLLVGYGTGVRVTLWQQRKAAKAAAVEFKARAVEREQR